MFNANNGYSLADVAAATGGNRNNDGAWGDGAWWIVLFVLFFAFGGFGNGFGGFGGGGGALQGYATQADLMRGFDNQTVVSKLDGISNGICSLGYDQLAQMNNINQNISNGFHGVDNAICNLGYQTQQGFNNTNMAMMQNTNAIQSTLNNMAAQNAACCCETQRQIERGFADTNYNMATQACETRQAIADSTRQVLDFLTQDKIATLTAENQSLKFAASQTAQNQFITQVGSDIVNRLQPVPVPAFPASNLYAYGNGSGCGCNSCC